MLYQTKKADGEMINPRIEKMAHDAFKEAFGDDYNPMNRKHHKLMLAHAAMLEMGAEYIRLQAFEKVFNHLVETGKESSMEDKIFEKLIDGKPATYEDSIKGE